MMNNSITDWVIDFVEAHYPANDDFDKRDVCDLVWKRLRLEYAYDATELFIASMDSVDWEAVEESFYPASVDLSWTATIEYTGTTSIEFNDRDDYMLYKQDPEGYLAVHINYEFANESYDSDISDIEVSED
jgi:hypothetical protein